MDIKLTVNGDPMLFTTNLPKIAESVHAILAYHKGRLRLFIARGSFTDRSVIEGADLTILRRGLFSIKAHEAAVGNFTNRKVFYYFHPTTGRALCGYYVTSSHRTYPEHDIATLKPLAGTLISSLIKKQLANHVGLLIEQNGY